MRNVVLLVLGLALLTILAMMMLGMAAGGAIALFWHGGLPTSVAPSQGLSIGLRMPSLIVLVGAFLAIPVCWVIQGVQAKGELREMESRRRLRRFAGQLDQPIAAAKED